MNEIKIFENEELGLQIRTILNPDGSISVSAEDTAIGFGWCRTETKNGKAYTSVMWSRMNGYCKELGFAHKCAKDDYIPESLYYLLGMKANNKKARKYQMWLAMEVVPSIRKTKTYTMPNTTIDTHTEGSTYKAVPESDIAILARQDTERLRLISDIMHLLWQRESSIEREPATQATSFSVKEFKELAFTKAAELSNLKGYSNYKRGYSDIYHGMTDKGVCWGTVRKEAYKADPSSIKNNVSQLSVLPKYQRLYLQVADELIRETILYS